MSKLSEALAAMDKMTPGPWEAIKPVNSNGFWHINNHSTSSGEIATNYGEKAMYNANITAAAPDALAWIKEALPWLESLRDALRGAEGSAHLDQFYALDALIARAKPEEVGK